MKTPLILLFILTSLFTTAQNQWYTKGAVNFEERTLLVGLRSEDPDIIKKFGKKKQDELAAYKKAIADFNQNIQVAMKDVWILNEDVQFKTMDQIKDLVMNPKTRESHAFLTHVTPNAKLFDDREGLALSNMDIVVGEVLDKPVVSTLMPYVNPTLGELMFGIQQLQAQMNNIIRFKGDYPESITPEYLSTYKALQLKELTLLLDSLQVNDKFSLESLKEWYPFPFRLTSKEEVEKKIIGHETGFAYLVSMPANTSLSGGVGDAREAFITYVHQISRTENGELLLYVTPGKAPDAVFENRMVNLKHLEYFAEQIQPSLKKKR